VTAQASYEKWKSLQSHWDDDDFLKSLTPLMKLRYRRLDAKVLRLFEEAFKKLKKPLLIDLGAGRGEFAFFLNQQGKAASWDYLGAEPSAEQLNQRDIPGLGLGFIRATAEQVPLQDMIAQGVLMKEALESYFKRLFPGINRSHKAKQTDHLFFFGPSDLKKLAEDARFDSVSVETYNYLKLPRLLEKLLGFLGPAVCSGLLDATDALGKAVLPGLGGGIILRAALK
jgi:hypothetical protein